MPLWTGQAFAYPTVRKTGAAANLADAAGKPLDGANAYVLHFDKGAMPPVDAIWSILYDSDSYQVANSLSRFAVSSWMPFKYDPDGSIHFYFQNASPGADKRAN